MAASTIVLASTAPVRGELREGKAVPDFTLEDLTGKKHALATEGGHPVVIVFGELYNKNTLAALDELARLADSKPFKETKASRFVILGSRDPTTQLREDWAKLERKSGYTVFHDRKRKVFESYAVKVLPTIVVLDEKRQLTLFLSGFPLNFTDVVTDAVLYAGGKIGRDRLDKSAGAGAAPKLDERRLKAVRTSRMGAALARRQLYEMAIQRFEDALELDSSLVDARLGLARVRLAQSSVQQAEELLQTVLVQAPGNVEAHIGLARIEIKRDQLEKAEKRLRQQIALHPQQPELQFLMGSAHERAGRTDEALLAYKRAAQLLLERYR